MSRSGVPNELWNEIISFLDESALLKEMSSGGGGAFLQRLAVRNLEQRIIMLARSKSMEALVNKLLVLAELLEAVNDVFDDPETAKAALKEALKEETHLLFEKINTAVAYVYTLEQNYNLDSALLKMKRDQATASLDKDQMIDRATKIADYKVSNARADVYQALTQFREKVKKIFKLIPATVEDKPKLKREWEEKSTKILQSAEKREVLIWKSSDGSGQQ